MWTEDRRLKQAAICRVTAPWSRSTGPRTEKGKAKVSQNAFKHGLRGGILRKAAELIAQSKKILKECEQ